MQVRAAGSACASGRADRLSLGHIETTAGKYRTQVSIQGLEAGAVVDHDHVAVAVAVCPCIDYYTAVRGIDVVAQLCR